MSEPHVHTALCLINGEPAPTAMTPPIRVLVEEQLGDVLDQVAPEHWCGHEELPPPPLPAPELLDTYAFAQSWAMRNCNHKRANRIVDQIAQQVECVDCGKRWFPWG